MRRDEECKWKRVSSLPGLVLTRKVGDQVVINHGELRIEIVEIHGSRVRIAFHAQKDISIKRAETVDPPDLLIGSPSPKRSPGD